jgi:hypothetical protein
MIAGRLGVDLEVLRRMLEPKPFERFNGEKSARLDVAIVGTEDAARSRREAEAYRRVVEFFRQRGAAKGATP